MSLLLSLLLAAAPASATELTFEFVGQPDCVALDYADGRTRLDNRCDHALLIDQSVQLRDQPRGPVMPGATTWIRDLSAFTLGMDGRLYRARAVIVEPEGSVEDSAGEDTGAAAVDTATPE